MFVLKEDGKLISLKAEQFVLEDHFQQLLEEYPELLAGALIDPEEPRRWLLIRREMSVPVEENGGGLWSADHLFLDQDGIPTIVEVKRQTDTRLRREVVAQMLDYAANGVRYWKAEAIRECFEANCTKKAKDPEQELKELFGIQTAPEKYWQQVKTNLEAEKVRLLFVADMIPRELRSVVEFLNRQMNPAEVLALELKQYVGDDGLRTIVPTLFGQTEQARVAKSSGTGKEWNKESWFEELESRFHDESILRAAHQIFDWMEKRSKLVYGHGKVDGSITACFPVDGGNLYPLNLYTQGKLYINFAYCYRGPFEDEAKRLEWMKRLNTVPGISLSPASINKMPAVQLATLGQDDRMQRFLSVMDWFADKVASDKNVNPAVP